MKVLVTGAAGFIGGQLWHTLWQRGDEVVGIDNFSYGNLDNLKFDDHDFGPEVRRMDIRDREALPKLFEEEKFDVVYNIAGIAPLPDCQSDPVQAVEVNTMGLVHVLECARRTGVKQVVQASTNAMYENETEFPTVEAKFNPPTLIYPNTKYCAERFAQSFADTYGMTVTCLRFANVYGPHIDCLRKQPPFVGYMIRELYYDRTPEFHSDGNQRRDYIYVDDLIALALRVVERPQPGFDAVNVSSNQSYSVRELYAIANKIMGKNIEAKYCPSSHYWPSTPNCTAAPTASNPKFWTTRSTSSACVTTPTPGRLTAGCPRWILKRAFPAWWKPNVKCWRHFDFSFWQLAFAGRHHAAAMLVLTANVLSPFLLDTQKEAKRCPLLSIAREARLRGCSPLRTPKGRSSSKKAKPCRSAARFLTLFCFSPIDPFGAKTGRRGRRPLHTLAHIIVGANIVRT